ncbi:hypothetical protein C8Q80DRAFT_724437 [Daedaleopsis nitida]|nr:hypothetical protein C8Q80DRAFT_724437 [Daedaleopsis nitida]
MASDRPSPPLKEWEKADKLNVELVGYGWQEKRVIVRFHLPPDRDQHRVKLALAFMGFDVKHSKKWLCESCGAPARETHFQTLSWPHLETPRLIAYVHFVCSMDESHVLEGLRESHDMMNLVNMGMLGPFPTSFPDRQPDAVYPLAGSCACCKRDETANQETGLKKCGKCKLTRYCSVECQKQDWPRHKVTCEKIRSVVFENWD